MRQLVLHHQGHGFALEDPTSVELTAVQEHLGKPEVVADGREQPASAGEHLTFRRIRRCDQRRACPEFSIGAGGVQRRQVALHSGRDVERGHRHTERPEQGTVEVAIERHAGHDFDDAGEDIDGIAVVPP